MNTNVRFRRIIAFIIDWYLSLLPCMIFANVFRDNLKSSSPSIALALILVLLLILSILFFIIRDLIFGGESFGKRVFRLKIINKETCRPASAIRKVLRNLFFVIYLIDGLVLIVSKQSLGDKATNTIVVKE